MSLHKRDKVAQGPRQRLEVDEHCEGLYQHELHRAHQQNVRNTWALRFTGTHWDALIQSVPVILSAPDPDWISRFNL